MDCKEIDNCANYPDKCDDCLFNIKSWSLKSRFKERDYRTVRVSDCCGEDGCKIDYAD